MAHTVTRLLPHAFPFRSGSPRRSARQLIKGQLSLCLLAGVLGMGCTVAHTPAEPTPVYASALPQAEVVAVERLSVNRPEAHLASSAPTPADAAAPAPTARVDVPTAPVASSTSDETVAPPVTSATTSSPPPKNAEPPAAAHPHAH